MSNSTTIKVSTLKHRKIISALFKSGKRIKSNSLQLIYTNQPSDTPKVFVGVSVPKQIFKRAVDRNLLKRRMREAFRLNNHHFLAMAERKMKQSSLMFVYISEHNQDYARIAKNMAEILTKLSNQIEIDK